MRALCLGEKREAPKKVRLADSALGYYLESVMNNCFNCLDSEAIVIG